jgi:hypothetical protein
MIGSSLNPTVPIITNVAEGLRANAGSIKVVTYSDGKIIGYECYNSGLRKKLIYPDNTYVT